MITKKRKIIAIVGPTASGKTGIGVKLAKEFNGEIISADSRQVYRGLDLGTGKDLAEYGEVKYHMIDIVDPGEKMTLFDYLPLARSAIEDIFARGKVPILVGGSGLYIQGLVEGFALQQKTENSTTPGLRGAGKKQKAEYSREQLDKLTTKELNEVLEKSDVQKYESIDHKNRHRLIRAIELAQEGLNPVKIKPDFEVLQIGVDVPRTELHQRIDKRVDERFEVGMTQEVRDLLISGVDPVWLIGLGLEYREITQYLLELRIKNIQLWEKLGENRDSSFVIHNSEFQAMSQDLKYCTHQFARRQMTWFHRFPEIQWLPNYEQIKRFAKIFLEH
ncbi:MAG: tRNA (adenosine(37)-N6)-dimethylallyltransferase MiaA [Candidatus Berkelbacteria bacterium]